VAINSSRLFVCRARTHPVTGETNTVPACAPTDKAIEGDAYGCCDEACPEPCEIRNCELPFPDHEGEIKEGVEVLVEGMDKALCVPIYVCVYADGSEDLRSGDMQHGMRLRGKVVCFPVAQTMLTSVPSDS
jgi:hypothetical protein